MRAWQVKGSFGLEALQLTSLPEASIGPDEVRLKVHACSLNYRDLMVIKGQYNPRQRLPLVPLSDGAGEIIELGALVEGFKLGDRVCATFSQNWDYGRFYRNAARFTLGGPLDGMLTESIVLNQRGLLKFPAYLSYQEAATLPCAALTAFKALTQEASLCPGDTILLQGTGGVSLFALQFAQVLGLKTIVISSSNDKLKRVRELGATELINYQEKPDWSQEVLSITGGQGVDCVVEVGGAKTFNQALASVKGGGTISVIGVLSGIIDQIDIRPILMNQIRINGVFVGSKQLFSAMNRMLEHSLIHPVIDQVFAFSDARAAFKRMESAQHFGKIVISVE